LIGKVEGWALSTGGKAIGVLPYFLANREIAHAHLSDINYVENMNQRKRTVHVLSDASITLPGVFGCMEELFEKLS
jgi:predicted Rossmann-fold nucleotide-binding protein